MMEIHMDNGHYIKTEKKEMTFEEVGKEVGVLVYEKQDQYGDSFGKSGAVLKILYPDGVRPEQYNDLLAVTRIIDKLFRIANGNKGNENAWKDIAGYGLLGWKRTMKKGEES